MARSGDLRTLTIDHYKNGSYVEVILAMLRTTYFDTRMFIIC
jgi:hypothetical protein